MVNFNDIFEELKTRKSEWFPMSDTDAVELIVNANMNGYINDEEKDVLLNFI